MSHLREDDVLVDILHLGGGLRQNRCQLLAVPTPCAAQESTVHLVCCLKAVPTPHSPMWTHVVIQSVGDAPMGSWLRLNQFQITITSPNTHPQIASTAQVQDSTRTCDRLVV